MRMVPKVPKTPQTADKALACQPELDFKILFLKTSHTSAVGHQELQLDSDWQFPACWLAFTRPEDVSKLPWCRGRDSYRDIQ